MTFAEDGTAGRGVPPVSLSVTAFAESKEAMAAPWFASLVRGEDTAQDLVEPLRAALSLITIELAEAQGRELLRIERQREETRRLEEARRREAEAARREAEAARHQSMLAELRLVLRAEDGDEPELGATSIANRVPDTWAALSQFLVDNVEAFCEWIADTEGVDAAAGLTEVLTAFGTSGSGRDRLLLELHLRFASAPRMVFRGHEIDRVSLAELARETSEEANADIAATIDSLFESRALSRLATLPGASELATIDDTWRAWVDEWIDARPLSPEPNLAWGRSCVLLAVVDDDERIRLEQRAKDAKQMSLVTGTPRGTRARVGDSVGVNLMMAELFLRKWNAAVTRLRRSLRQKSSTLKSSADLGLALSGNVDRAKQFFLNQANVYAATVYLSLSQAPNEAIEMLGDLVGVVQKASALDDHSPRGMLGDASAVRNAGVERSLEAHAEADRSLFTFTTMLRPGEERLFDGRRVDTGSLPTFAFRSSNWSVVSKKIAEIAEPAEKEAVGEGHVTRVFDSRILQVGTSGDSVDSTWDVDQRWRNWFDDFTGVMDRAVDASRRPYSHQLSRKWPRELVLGVLLTAASHEETRERLAHAARGSVAEVDPSLRRVARSAEAGGSVGAHLAICLMAELTQARAKEHTGGLAVARPIAAAAQGVRLSRPAPTRAQDAQGTKDPLTPKDWVFALLQGTIAGALAFLGSVIVIFIVAATATMAGYPGNPSPVIIPGGIVCGIGVFVWQTRRGLRE